MFGKCMVLLLFPLVGAIDPCTNYKLLHSSEYRGDQCMLYEIDNAVCDRSIDSGWYAAKHDEHFLEMPMTCPQKYACGTDFPIWLNGTHPSIADGIVTRRLCMRSTNNCCKTSIAARVQNCGAFFVYNITYTAMCNYAYCFGNNTCPQQAFSTDPNDEKHPFSETNLTGIIVGTGAALLLSVIAIGLAVYRIQVTRKSRIASQVNGKSDKHLQPHETAQSLSAPPASPPPPYKQ